MTALALRDDQTTWDDNQLAVLRSTGIDEDVSAAELTAFLHECQRRRLDPFTRQIYLLGRWDYQRNRKVYKSQTSIDGFRLIARRAADEAKESIEYEDSLWCGPDGKWVDVWLDDTAPAACKFVVLRNGKRFPAVARFSGYVQMNKRGGATGQWRKMADNQIAKCAEALALRKAFPEELGSLYTDDEMAQADNPQHSHSVQAQVIQDGEPADSAVTDAGWLETAREQAASFVTKDAGTVLWHEVAAKRKDGKVTRDDAMALGELITARIDDLAKDAQEDAGVVEGVIVDELPDGDPWAEKVSDIVSHEDAEAAMGDLDTTLKAGHISRERHAQVAAMIRAKAATFTEAAA